ncbi:MAG TPA: hypothetical protein VGO11_23780 [Chthoniobacteraceae bacterium]|nr:hypothetical protein [Chthoniobacteraceae bacterium]
MGDSLHPEQIKALRRLTSDQRLSIGMQFIRAGRRFKRAALRKQHPDWSDIEVAEEMRRLTLHGRT